MFSPAAPPSSDNATSEHMIDLADVHLTLSSDAGAVNILRGINLRVRRGETVAIVGPSGSGKSSLLSVMSGLEPATSGRVVMGGHDLSAMDEDELALFRRNLIGIVFQSFHLIPTMTAVENVAVPMELGGRRDAFDVAARELQSVGLGERLRHYPAQLSGGEQQRVALARAMAGNPALVLADEPTGNLDGATGSSIVDLLFGRVRERDATLLLITHDEALARRCDRMVHLKDGRIVADDRQAGPDRVSG